MDTGDGETAPPEQPEFARGAGGKMRRPLNRKSRTTPYARPQPNQSQTPLAVRGGNGGWLSKIVDTAYRLIGAGTNRLLPSLFSRTPSIESPASSSSDEDHDNLQGEAKHEVGDGNNQGISDLALVRSTQSPNAESVEDDSKCGGPFDSKREDKSTDLPNADGLLEIEQLIKRKMFTRDEVDRLVEILHSKTADLPTGEGRDKQPAANVREEVPGPGIASDLASKLKEEKQEVLNIASREVLTPLPKSNLLNEIGASPVDIARAYMGHRMPETGDDRALVHLDGHSAKPFIGSSSHDSSIRWPGATVPNRYLTPQTQRSRYGLHDFRRTPYSRSIHSMSKSKLIQTAHDGNKSSGTVSPLLKQSHTVINLQAKSRSSTGDGDYGSVGPIRRVRNKFSIGTPQKFDSFPPLAGPSQREKTNLPLASLPTYRKSIDDRGTSNTMEPQWADDRPQSLDIGVPTVPRHSSQMARKILEHLDRRIPTPKEKYAELKLATSWNKDTPSGQIKVHLEPWSELPGKVVLVTGASSGLGCDFCRDLTRVGCRVVAAARRVDRLKSLCDEINGLASSPSNSGTDTSSPRAVAVELDVSADGATIEKSVQKAWDAFGHIDALINNAGVRGNVKSPLELTEEEWDHTFKTNAKGSWLVTKYVCIRMRDSHRGGSVINISSIAGLNRGQLPGGLAYASSKAALNTMTKVMALELGVYKIRVNSISPGLFKSEITQSLMQKDWLNNVALRTVPLRQYGTADPALTSLVRYLIHDSSEYVSGNIFVVDAGATLPGVPIFSSL